MKNFQEIQILIQNYLILINKTIKSQKFLQKKKKSNFFTYSEIKDIMSKIDIDKV